MSEIVDCVEAHITEIHAPEGTDEISITLRLVGGKAALLRAQGVDRFLANEFREKNIIDRITNSPYPNLTGRNLLLGCRCCW